MPQILLIRHCESSGPAPDAALTERGAAQARALAEYLAGHSIDHIISSPYARARATIAPYAARIGLAVQTDERLAERHMSPHPVDHWRDVVARSFVDLDHSLPGGESGRETLARGWAAIESALTSGHRLPIVVSHGQLISLVLHFIDGRFGFAGWQSLSNPDVYLVEGGAGFPFTFERVWT
jgi:2,3-bisphosphoglycerate-dependent phosphoglycerate mutase